METKFENSNSFRNLTIKGVFSRERKRWRHKFEVEKGRQSVRERLGIQGLGNTTLIIIAVYIDKVHYVQTKRQN